MYTVSIQRLAKQIENSIFLIKQDFTQKQMRSTFDIFLHV